MSSNVVRLPNASALTGDDCRLLVESVVDYAIFMLDVDGHVVTWNPGAERIKGYRAEEIIGQHFSKFFTEEDIAAGKPESELRRAREQGRCQDESWRLRKDGSRFWGNVVITALRDEHGKLRGYGKVTRDLTEQRRSEDELRRTQERFRLLIENVSDYAIYTLDESGRVTTWNLGAQRMKGYSTAEIVGQSFERFFPPEDIAAGKPARELSKAAEQGRNEDEGWRVRQDGTRFWANAVLSAVRDGEGKLVGFVKITQDLTARREAQAKDRQLLREQTAREVAEREEAKLRESEERYRELSRRLEIVFEGVTDGITVQDVTGRVLLANRAAARLLGLASVKELTELPFADWLGQLEVRSEQGQELGEDELPFRHVLTTGESASALLYLHQRATGHQLWANVRCSSIMDQQGKPSLAISIWHDGTAEQESDLQAKYLAEATAALGSSLVQEEMLKAVAGTLVPGLADWCSIYLVEGEQVHEVAVAHAAPEKQVGAQAYNRRFPPDAAHAGAVWSVVRSGKSRVFNDLSDQTLTTSTVDPEALAALRVLSSTAALLVPIRLRQEVVGVIALAGSRLDRRYTQTHAVLGEELGRRVGVALENARLYRAAQAAARDAERAAQAAEEASRAKDEFLATVSHELRTPLTAILGWSSLLMSGAASAAPNKPIEIIHRNARAQVRIIDDVLDMSRVITGKFRIEPRPTDAVAVVRDALEVVRPSAEAKSIQLVFEAPADACLLEADADRLQQVVWNLLSNSIKFTDEGGRVTASLRQDGARVTLRVADTGAGIDAALLPYVFDRFRQADSSITRRVGGLGLGLAIVRHIVELHGGRVWAESPGRGAGATFTVELPIRAVAQPAPHDAASASERSLALPSVSSGALRGLRVLIVDDEPDARDLVGAVLSHAGAVVATAGSAAEGFELFRHFCPDLVVSDLGMPDEDGFSFMRRVRALPLEQGGGVPAIALTAFTRGSDVSRARQAGFSAHIGKPVDPGALTTAVANLARPGSSRGGS
jgi:PAS domain S-box-containing protein